MKSLALSLIILVAHLCLTAPLVGKEVPAAKRTSDQPNFIIIFTDDQGYNDLGCFGSKAIKTPHLDRLAKEGRRFTQFYVPCSVCSPSRAALLTGSYPKRVGMHRHVLFPKSDYGLNPAEHTIADQLRSTGYATACIGKWHLGHHPETLPRQNGFDSYYGIPYSNDMNHPDNKGKASPASDDGWINQDKQVKLWNTPLIHNEKIIELPVNQRTITRRYTDKAIEFVTANKGKPFFLYLPHSMPHIPLFVPKDVHDPDPKNAYKCVIEHIDAEVGRLVKTVRDLGLANNTYIIFTTDNGPWLHFKHHGGSAFPLRDGKGTTFEGGQRVPCIMWGPGRIPADTTSSAFGSTLDLLPTITSLSGSKLPAKIRIDGYDLTKTITGDVPSPRKELVYYSARGSLEGIRQGDWKILVKKTRVKRGKKGKKAKNASPGKTQIFLFNLADDVSETTNLADKNPERVKSLQARMKELDNEITANARPVWRKK
jgi:arylsulfatase A